MSDETLAQAFVAGWFAHARNPKHAPLLVEEAWHAYRLIESAERPAPEGPEGECGSCGESPEGECPKSLRPCGHHCNHVWTHDSCDWCGEEFGPEPPSECGDWPAPCNHDPAHERQHVAPEPPSDVTEDELAQWFWNSRPLRYHWEQATEYMRESYRDDARAILSAFHVTRRES